MMFGWQHGMWDAAGWLVMSAVMLAVLAAVVIAVLVGSRAVQSRERPWDSARRILDERFAKGEIDEEEYQQRREVLDHR